MAIDWDQAVLLPNLKVFGEAIQPTYTPQGGAGFPIDGVFDRPFKSITMQIDGETSWSTTKPMIGVRLAQFPQTPVKGDQIYIPSADQTFLVSDVRPDGKGWALLELMIKA